MYCVIIAFSFADQYKLNGDNYITICQNQGLRIMKYKT